MCNLEVIDVTPLRSNSVNSSSQETPEAFLARIRSMSSATYKPASVGVLSGDWCFHSHHGIAEGRRAIERYQRMTNGPSHNRVMARRVSA